LLNRANSLAFYELLGDAELMNTEFSKYETVTISDIEATAKEIFKEENSCTLYYYAK
jgi:predicted Zn-dependent peptidase